MSDVQEELSHYRVDRTLDGFDVYLDFLEHGAVWLLFAKRDATYILVYEWSDLYPEAEACLIWLGLCKWHSTDTI